MNHDVLSEVTGAPGGGRIAGAPVRSSLRRRLMAKRGDPDLRVMLSPGEIELVRLKVQDLRAAEIADRLGWTVHCVNTGWSKVRGRLGNRGLIGIFKLAVRQGVVRWDRRKRSRVEGEVAP